MAESNVSYIEKCLSLSVSEWEKPWRMEVAHPFDNQKKIVYYLANEKYPNGTFYENRPVIKAGEKLEYILSRLLLRIEKYPYYWPLENQKVDAFGYDFYTDLTKESNNEAQYIEVTEGADTLIKEKLSIEAPGKEAWRVLTGEDYVSGDGIGIRLDITLEKAGPINHLALELFSSKTVELSAVLYQEDVTKYVPMKEMVIEDISLLQSNRSLTVNFPKAVYAKRIVLILTQKEYTVNKYMLPKDAIAQAKVLKYIQKEEARMTAENTGSLQYDVDYKSDSFADVFVRSGLKGYAKLMKEYKKAHEAWLKKQKK